MKLSATVYAAASRREYPRVFLDSQTWTRHALASTQECNVGYITCIRSIRCMVLNVIRKFFLNHNKSFRWHLGDYEKHDFFFHLKACERRNFDFCVFLGMCSGSGGRVGRRRDDVRSLHSANINRFLTRPTRHP